MKATAKTEDRLYSAFILRFEEYAKKTAISVDEYVSMGTKTLTETSGEATDDDAPMSDHHIIPHQLFEN